MTNIEKVKRILDAGHWVKVSYGEFHDDVIVTSYTDEGFSYTTCGIMYGASHHNTKFENCTIEVIQRIPTAYKAGDKVLVLSNNQKNIKEMQDMVGKVCEIESHNGMIYSVWDNKKDNFYYFPHHCLSPAFDEEPTLSGKEAKIVIDGKEYTATLKLI